MEMQQTKRIKTDVEQMNSSDLFSQQPKEIFDLILSFCEDVDILSAAQCSKATMQQAHSSNYYKIAQYHRSFRQDVYEKIVGYNVVPAIVEVFSSNDSKAKSSFYIFDLS
jgi:hypothetical protein